MKHAHRMITSKALRSAYAAELWKSRIMRHSMTASEYTAFRFGVESGLWAVQQLLNADYLK